MLAGGVALGFAACDGGADAASPLGPPSEARAAEPDGAPGAVAADAEHLRARAHGFEFTGYPGFVSRSVVRTADGAELELIRQTEPYRLGARVEPATSHVVRLAGGPHDQDVTLRIDDPRHRIARVVVELYATGWTPGTPHEAQPAVVETWEITEWPTRCPPNCDDDG